MLTQKRKTNSWKYALALPIMLGCTFLFAKSEQNHKREKVGNITTFEGHKIYWGTAFVDTYKTINPETGEIRNIVIPNPGQPYKLDNDSLAIFRQAPPNWVDMKFRDMAQDVSAYFTEKFKEKMTDPLDSISQIAIFNVIVDANGKIKYYEIGYRGRHFSDKQFNSNPVLDPIIEDIVDNCPSIETASLVGENKAAYIGDVGFIILHNSSGRAKKLN